MTSSSGRSTVGRIIFSAILSGRGRRRSGSGLKTLSYTHPGVARTQDWKRHEILFNSVGHEEANVYIGIWSGESGRMWVDDASLRRVAGVNMLRREGCPVRVTGVDGRTVFEEGRDFEKWIHPKMGADPWPGSFQVVHPQPPLVLTRNSRIMDGQDLKVSFYHTVLIHDEQVGCCLVHDEVFTHLERQIGLVHKYLKPKTYFMNHDEIRLAGHCELCRASGRTSGELLADHVRRCTNIIGAVNPEAAVVVWSDMFDPHHNARQDYYLVANTLVGSWDGLAKDVTVVNWNGGKKRESLRFFAERGHRQVVAGFYDHPDVQGRLRQWTDAAAGLEGVDGYMYTTWRKDYSKLEEFAAAVRNRMGGGKDQENRAQSQ